MNPEFPSHIFVGSIVTMDDKMPTAEAIAISRDKIVAVGSRAEIEKLAGPETQKIELGSQVMYPGLIEAHMHLWVSALNYKWIDCSAMENKTLDDVKKRISDAAAAAKPGEWVLGKLFDPSLLPNNPSFTTADLDPLAPNNPVFILNASMHYAYVNSKALELCKIAPDAPNPPGGTYGRDANGKVDGTLGEMGAILPFVHSILAADPNIIQENIGSVTQDAANVGVTTMREAGTGGMFGPKELSILHELQKQGQIKTRVSIALFDEAAKTWPESPETAFGAGDEYIWIGARKIVADGSNQGKSGYLSQPYLGSTDNRGTMDITPEALQERIKWCNDNGWQIMVHANGDAAIDIVVQAYEQALAGNDKKLRHRIEHCSLVANDELFARMEKIGVSPSFLINHVYFWGQTLRDNILGPDRIYMLDRTAAALAAGLKFTLHSDYNVSPINPLHYVKVATTRTLWNSDEILVPDQKVSVEQALKSVTIDAAWQINMEEKIGSLTAGKFADFVILDQDPQKVEPENIDQIKVMQTWLGGQTTYQRT